MRIHIYIYIYILCTYIYIHIAGLRIAAAVLIAGGPLALGPRGRRCLNRLSVFGLFSCLP